MFAFLSNMFWLFGISSLIVLVWHFVSMQVRGTEGSERAQQNEVAVGGGVFIGACAVLWLVFAGLSAAI